MPDLRDGTGPRSDGERSLFSLTELRERRHSYWTRAEFEPGDYSMVETDETDAILALINAVETAICRRFTVTPCRQRPEIHTDDYCETCRALSRFVEYVDA